MNYADPRDVSYIASANKSQAAALAADYARARRTTATPRHRHR